MATTLQKAMAEAQKTGGAANAASSSGTQRTVQSVRQNADQKRQEFARQELQKNPASQMTTRQKQLVRGLIDQHPEALNNVYTNLNNSYTAAYNGLQSGNVRTPEQLAGVKTVLDAVQSNLRSLSMLKEALGQESPRQIGLDIDTVYSGYRDMMQDYERISSKLASSMAPGVAQLPGMARQTTIADPRTGGVLVGGGVTAGLNRGALPVLQQQNQAAQAAERERQRLMSIDAAANRAEAERLNTLRTEAGKLARSGAGDEAVNTYLRENGVDVDSGLAERNRLIGVRDQALNLQRYQHDIEGARKLLAAEGFKGVKELDQINQRIAELGNFDLASQEAALRLDAAQGERLQTQTRMTETALNAPDFARTSTRGAAVQNPTAAEVNAMTGSARTVEDQIGNIVTWSRENRDAIEESLRAATGRIVGDLAYSYMTDDEVAVYNYWLAKEGKARAGEYLDSITDELHYRQAADRYQRIEGKWLPEVGAGMEAGLDQFTGGMRSMGRMLRGDDSYTPGSVSAYLGGMAREGLADEGPTVWKGSEGNTSLGQVAYDLTQTTANMLPSILASAAANAVLPGSGEVLGVGLIGASAGGNAYEQMINLGYRANQARTYAILTGASEAGLQYLIGGVTQLGGRLSSVATDTILKNVDNALARTAIKLGSEFVSEGVEEYLQDVLEPVFRNIAFGERNTIDPLSPEALYSGVLGGVSALLMSGGGTISETMAQRKLGLQLQRAGVTAKRLAEIGQTFPADSVANRLANRLTESTDAYTMARLFNEIGATMTDQNIQDIQAALIEKGVTERDAQEIAMELAIAVENPGALEDIQKKVLEKCSVAADVINEVILNGESAVNQRNEAVRGMAADLRTGGRNVETETTETAEPEIPEEPEVPVPERVDNDLLTRERETLRDAVRDMDDGQLAVLLAEKSREYNEKKFNALHERDFDQAEAYARLQEDLEGAMQAAQDQPQAEKISAMRAYINNSLGGINDGRERTERAGTPVSDGAGRRDAGVGAGVEAGRVRPVGYGADTATPPVRGGNGRVFDVEVRKTPAELNIPNGSETSLNGVIPADSWDEGMRNAAEKMRRRGYEMTYVTGPIQVTTKTGRTKSVNGVAYGNQVVVQADSRLYTPEQITDHEEFHTRVIEDPALLEDLKERFVRDHGAEELREIITRYAQIFDFCYGEETEGMTSDERAALYDLYLEEYFADAAGGINRARMGSRGASRDTSMTREIIAEREGMGNGSGGMPGVRYSNNSEQNNTSVVVESGPSALDRDGGSLAKDLAESIPQLQDMKAVAELTGREMNDRAKKPSEQIRDLFRRIGERVTRRGFGIVHLSEYGVDGIINHRPLNRAKMITLETVPAVIRDGKIIRETDNWKGRGYRSYIFAAPVTVAGKQLYVAAVVNETNGHQFYLNECVDSEGNYVRIREEPSDNAKTGFTVQDGVTRGPESSSRFSISDSAENSNTEIGLRSNIPGLTRWDREAEARAEREAQAERAPSLRESEESVNRGRFSVAEEDVGEIGEIDPREERRALMEKAVEDMTARELRRAVAEDKADVAAYEKFLARDIPEDVKAQMRAELTEIRERLGKEQARVREIDQKAREERKAVLERQKARTTPTIARRQFVKQVMDRFSTPMGERTAMGNMLGSLFDDAFSRGSINIRDMDAVFDTLLDRGFVTVDADPYYQDMRSNIAGTRIFVPDDIRGNFGDDYEALRRRAYAAGVILTRDANDMQIDSLNAELSGSFPGAFRADETDLGTMLDNIIEIAEQGKAERITLAEMLGRVQNDTGWSVDEQIEHMHEQFVQDIEKAMHAAGIEVQQKATNALQMAREREARQESVRRQAARRQLSEMRQKYLKLLQWMNRNKHRATTPEMRAAIDEMLERINYLSIQMADETRYLDKYGATVGDVVKMYEAGKKNNPNWTPSKEIEALVHRTHSLALGEMSIETLDELYHNLLEIQTEIFNAKHMIDDEQHALVQDYYDESTGEIKNSDGKGKLSVMDTALTPINQIMKLGGWNEGGAMHRVGKMLQDGERTAKSYEVGARRMLRDFTLQNAKWLTTADGRGRKGVWLKYDITPLVKTDFAGNSTYEDETKTVWLTPLQRVHLYLESKNYQNMNHMQEGGRTFANKELYAKGKRSEAFQQGTTVKLSKEWVDTICRDMTAEEIELARILEKYYNEYAPEQINPVSRKLVGYDKAVIDNYAPIQTNSSYNASQPGLYDLTAAGVGVMKDRQAVANNPSLNVGAIDAFERHLRQTSKYVGLAIPVSNVNRLMNWQDKENNTSFKDILAHKWGGEAVDRLNGFLTDIQNPKSGPDSKLGQLLNKGVSNYIGATFAFNVGIAAKQFASFPAAAAVLDGKLPSVRQLRNIDEDLILKYTPELAYRQLGQGTPEIAKMRENPNILDRNKITQRWLRGGLIQDVDVFTVRTMWAWAENTVDKHNTGEDRVEKGSDEYYRRVADVFNEAVNLTQPMYDFMNRAQIMNSKDAITRTFTMFKTVPLQEFNTMARYIGEAKNGGKEAKRKAARAVGTVIASTLMLETIELANAWIKNGLKGYKDDDDELTAKSLATNFGLNMISDLMGIFPGGSQLFEILLHKNGASGSNGFTLVGSDQINELIEVIQNGGDGLWKTMTGIWDVIDNGGDVGEYLRRHGGDIAGGVHDLAVAVAKYGGGLPVENIEKYMGGILAKAWPDGKAYLQSLTDTTTKKDLDYMAGPEMPARLNSLLAIRNIDADDGTTEELARLYHNGYKTSVPSDTPEKITVNSEERELTPFEMQTYDNAYSAAIGESLDALVESEAYIRADDKTRAKMLDRLYEYAKQTAAREVTPDYEGDGWTRRAAEAAENGLPLEAYIALQGAGLEKTAEKLDFIDDMKLTDEKKGMLYYYGVASEERMEDLDNLRKAGMDWGTAYETVKQYMEIDAEDMSANQKAAEFATWAADNLTAEEMAAARENLTFSSGFKANTDTYDKLVAAGVSNDTALKIYSGWGALEPEGDATQVSDWQRIAYVADLNVSDREKAATFGTMDSAMWRRLEEAGASQSAAIKAMGAVATLRPEPGEESVSDIQKINAVYKAVSGNDDQMAAIQAALSYDTQREKVAISAGHGITAKSYVDFRNTILRFYEYDPDGSATSLNQKECQAALDSMDLSLYDKAVLWQIQMMGKEGKNNPYSTGVGLEIYNEYQAWSVEQKEKAEKEKTSEKNSEPVTNSTSNLHGVQIPTLNIP